MIARGEVFVRSTDRRAAHAAGDRHPPAGERDLAWSPDNQHLYFASGRVRGEYGNLPGHRWR
ncbi:MAG: hypothetical protein KatS3mg103_0969 [Phycisphaerales bacterium]|nr:MAG: hypothetical protein KatS3mg103_0969 [Phycisphaerales bacterium]